MMTKIQAFFHKQAWLENKQVLVIPYYYKSMYFELKIPYGMDYLANAQEGNVIRWKECDYSIKFSNPCTPEPLLYIRD